MFDQRTRRHTHARMHACMQARTHTKWYKSIHGVKKNNQWSYFVQSYIYYTFFHFPFLIKTGVYKKENPRGQIIFIILWTTHLHDVTCRFNLQIYVPYPAKHIAMSSLVKWASKSKSHFSFHLIPQATEAARIKLTSQIPAPLATPPKKNPQNWEVGEWRTWFSSAVWLIPSWHVARQNRTYQTGSILQLWHLT